MYFVAVVLDADALCAPHGQAHLRVCHLRTLHAGDMASMTDFAMSTIKPMTPAWLYAGWKYLAARPDIIKRGWDACSLCSMFDERRLGVVRQAKLATHDTSHRLYPLFPSNDLATLPLEVDAGKHEQKMEPLYEKPRALQLKSNWRRERDPSLVDAEPQQGGRAALQAVAMQPAPGGQPARSSAAQAGAHAGQALFPIFAAARRAAQPSGSSSH
jgi:hypothetical protein